MEQERLIKTSTLGLPGAYIMNMMRYVDSMTHPMELMMMSIRALVFRKA
jgi:hypothetical protein